MDVGGYTYSFGHCRPHSNSCNSHNYHTMLVNTNIGIMLVRINKTETDMTIAITITMWKIRTKRNNNLSQYISNIMMLIVAIILIQHMIVIRLILATKTQTALLFKFVMVIFKVTCSWL